MGSPCSKPAPHKTPEYLRWAGRSPHAGRGRVARRRGAQDSCFQAMAMRGTAVRAVLLFVCTLLLLLCAAGTRQPRVVSWFLHHSREVACAAAARARQRNDVFRNSFGCADQSPAPASLPSGACRGGSRQCGRSRLMNVCAGAPPCAPSAAGRACRRAAPCRAVFDQTRRSSGCGGNTRWLASTPRWLHLPHLTASASRARASPAAAAMMPTASVQQDANGKWTGLRVSYQARFARCGGARCNAALTRKQTPQGVPGAYSEQASLLAYDGCTPAPFDQFENAFEVRAACARRPRACCSAPALARRRWSSSLWIERCCLSRTRWECAPTALAMRAER